MAFNAAQEFTNLYMLYEDEFGDQDLGGDKIVLSTSDPLSLYTENGTDY